MQMTAGFLAYYLLSEVGLEKVGAASPGTADHNRTLSRGNLARIEVPTPSLSIQQSYGRLRVAVAGLRLEHAAIRAADDALLPAMLERIFRSET